MCIRDRSGAACGCFPDFLKTCTGAARRRYEDMIVAVCGKGGVGKTTVTAVAARELSRLKSVKALVVDADPGGGLEMALSIKPKKTLNDCLLYTSDAADDLLCVD